MPRHPLFDRLQLRAVGSSLVFIFVLALAVTGLPLAVLLFVIIKNISQNAEEAQKGALTYSAATIAAAVDAELQRYVTLGEVFSRSRALQQGDLDTFRQDVLRQLEGSKEVAIVIHEDDRQVFNSAFPGREDLPRRSAEGYRSQLKAENLGTFVVSNITFGALQQRWVATVEIPRHIAGSPYSVTVVVPLKPFQSILNVSSVGKGWVVGIADADGRFIAGFPETNRDPGKPISPDWKKHLRSPGLAEFRSLEGHRIVNANAHPALADWTVGVAIMRSELDAVVRQSYRSAIVAASLLLLLAAGLSTVFAYRIAASAATFRKALLDKLAGADVPEPRMPTDFLPLWQGVSQAVDTLRRLNAELDASLREAHDAKVAARDASQILRAIADNSNDLIFAKDRERRLVFVSNALSVLLQRPVADLLNRDETGYLVDQEQIEAIRRHDVDVMSQRQALTVEETVTTPTGPRVFLSNKLPWLNDDGEVIGLLGIAVDITERKRAEERIETVMREVSHRAKNILAVIQAIARNSGRHATHAEFIERFNQRLFALSQSMDLLVHNDWRGVDLNSLIDQQLRHLPDHRERVSSCGPYLFITAAAAQTIGMVIHELSTNALKHGALSVREGSVRVRWEVNQDTFVMQWSEAGGPRVNPPERKGFGSTVLQSLVSASLQCSPTLNFAPDGFSWKIECDVRDLVIDNIDPTPIAAGSS